jgi:peptidoglycan/xylan/chitin deacetylase (PgdA/CDA1 family)
LSALEASGPNPLLDYFRIPYEVADRGHAEGERLPLHGCGWVRSCGPGRAARYLLWPSDDLDGLGAPARLDLGSIVVHASVLPDRAAEALLADSGSWTRAAALARRDGSRAASLWRESDGSILLPFDPAEAVLSCWSEAYRTAGTVTAVGRSVRSALPLYYRLRPLLPRWLQTGLRRAVSRLQSRSPFPRWPVETSLHDLYELVLDLLREVAEGPVPFLGAWPEGREWALVLTHDVETAAGYERIPAMRRVEEELGLRSSWNFVPRRYGTSPSLIAELQESGHEVGVHGLYHDGRDLESLERLEERLPAIRDYAARWNAVGFRSPATHRAWELMPLLGFDYDSSYPDTDPYEPQAGGCCTWLPYFNGELVELPITLPQDYTLFVILRHRDEGLWREKAEFLRSRGGMAVSLTHPDYIFEEPLLGGYERFLRSFVDDSTAWHALPREVSSWWRRRAASKPVLDGGEWTVEGAAAGEAKVLFR